jgi:hypothetical protein
MMENGQLSVERKVCGNKGQIRCELPFQWDGVAGGCENKNPQNVIICMKEKRKWEHGMKGSVVFLCMAANKAAR